MVTLYKQPYKHEDAGYSYERYTPVWYKVKPRGAAPAPYRTMEWFATMSKEGKPFPRTSCLGYVYTNSIVNSASPVGAHAASVTTAQNRAYGKLVAKLQSDGGDLTSERSGTAALGVAVAERRKTIEFLTERASAVAEYTRLHSLNADSRAVAGAKRRLLALQKMRRHKRWRKQASTIRSRWGVPRWLSARWLEYWLCVAPTIGDIHMSMAVLSRDIAYGKLRGRAKSAVNLDYRDRYPTSGTPVRVITESNETEYLVQTGGQFVMTNPNLALAQSLGLLNPFVIGGELVPFSFVVGWFVNWSQVLSSWTDFWGWTVSNTYSTIVCRSVGERYHWDKVDNPLGTTMKYQSFAMFRGLGITMPKLRATLPERLSLSRAATSISLVVQLLTKKG